MEKMTGGSDAIYAPGRGVSHGLQKIANVNGKHLSAYVRHMQEDNLSASTIKTDLAAIRFWHDQIPQTKHRLPDNEAFDLERRSFLGVDRTWAEEEFAHMISEAIGHGRFDYAAAMILARRVGLRIHEVKEQDASDEVAKLQVNRWLGHERVDVTEIYLAPIR